MEGYNKKDNFILREYDIIKTEVCTGLNCKLTVNNSLPMNFCIAKLPNFMYA